MTKEKIVDIVKRAGKTFAQAFLSSITIDNFIGVADRNALKQVAVSALVGAVAAGISAVWNTFTAWLSARLGVEDEDDGEDDLDELL